MSEIYNPDWRYANMTQTEIEDHVKARSSQLLSQVLFVINTNGKKPPPRLEMALWDEKADRWVG